MSSALPAQEIRLQHVEPPGWWTGFKNPGLQVMVHGENIASASVTLSFPGVILEKIHKTGNPNYLFIDLKISSSAKPGSFTIEFKKGSKVVASWEYNLSERQPGSSQRKGFNSSDVIYLLMPDRFANGDDANDTVQGMKEKADRRNPDGRHGGDLKGILDHLDYLEKLGVTALWINPLLENDMPKYSYHGYSTTDYYRIDPRFGSNRDYATLSQEMHRRGMKLVMDMIFNHCGSEHWWMKDLPSPDWVHTFPEFTRTSYRAGTMSDPYVSFSDSIRFLKGWFDQTMPDLNQHNPFLAKYLIQNSIWWIETAGLDGIRQDTYPYAYKDFMAEWDRAVLAEYPDFNIVGECWLTTPGGISYWQKDARNRDGYNSYLPSVFDFAMYDALRLGFMERDGWNSGIFRLYEILSQDFLYPDPSNIVVFADNHDVDRYLNSQKGDIRRLKMAMAFVLTTRGIPEIFYGTEILLNTGERNGHGDIRKDFPGGWKEDPSNGFTGEGLSAEQKEMQEYLRRLLNWRKTREVIHTGKLKQFLPADGIYVYFRYDATDTVMVVFNNDEQSARRINRSLYAEFLGNAGPAYDPATGTMYDDLSSIVLPPKSALILDITRPK